MATFQELTQLEDVLGHYGGQVRSFDWVFSPRGQGGRPQPMFNHYTGDVDPAVVTYWQQHYDIAYRVAQQWPAIGHDLRGKGASLRRNSGHVLSGWRGAQAGCGISTLTCG